MIKKREESHEADRKDIRNLLENHYQDFKQSLGAIKVEELRVNDNDPNIEEQIACHEAILSELKARTEVFSQSKLFLESITAAEKRILKAK